MAVPGVSGPLRLQRLRTPHRSLWLWFPWQSLDIPGSAAVGRRRRGLALTARARGAVRRGGCPEQRGGGR